MQCSHKLRAENIGILLAAFTLQNRLVPLGLDANQPTVQGRLINLFHDHAETRFGSNLCDSSAHEPTSNDAHCVDRADVHGGLRNENSLAPGLAMRETLEWRLHDHHPAHA